MHRPETSVLLRSETLLCLEPNYPFISDTQQPASQETQLRHAEGACRSGRVDPDLFSFLSPALLFSLLPVHLKRQCCKKTLSQTSLKHALCKSSLSVVTMQGRQQLEVAARSLSLLPGGCRQKRKEALLWVGKDRQIAVALVEMWG